MSLDVHLYVIVDTGAPEKTRSDLYNANITHNLAPMAGEAGIYEHLWRPEEINIETARDLIGPLSDGLDRLEQDPKKYKAFNAPNGWGLYEHFVPFVRNYRDACRQHPKALVEVFR